MVFEGVNTKELSDEDEGEEDDEAEGESDEINCCCFC